MAASKKPIPVKIPDPISEVKQWLILGIDPSMSRSGYSLMRVLPDSNGTKSHWVKVGSVKPESSSDPIWVRSKMMAKYLQEITYEEATSILGNDKTAWRDLDSPRAVNQLGLIISMEFPTPMNDFLVALNRIIHLVFFQTNLSDMFSTVRILMTNASTLRSLMNLTKKGAKNKSENIDKAYEYLDKSQYPKLDTDACDAVLLSMVARYAVSILMGYPDEVPEKFLTTLCNSNQEVKGKGRNSKIVTKGLLHRKEYFYSYKRSTFKLLVNDASSKEKKLQRIEYEI